MKKMLGIAALLLASAWAQASALNTPTVGAAADAPMYGTYHDKATDFVFVKLADGWSFVARDEGAQSHDVFRDAHTGFVFVKLSSGWKFVGAQA